MKRLLIFFLLSAMLIWPAAAEDMLPFEGSSYAISYPASFTVSTAGIQDTFRGPDGVMVIMSNNLGVEKSLQDLLDYDIPAAILNISQQFAGAVFVDNGSTVRCGSVTAMRTEYELNGKTYYLYFIPAGTAVFQFTFTGPESIAKDMLKTFSAR